jgi:hypothetical protein
VISITGSCALTGSSLSRFDGGIGLGCCSL